MRQKLFFEDAFEAAYEKSTLGTLIIVLCKCDECEIKLSFVALKNMLIKSGTKKDEFY